MLVQANVLRCRSCEVISPTSSLPGPWRGFCCPAIFTTKTAMTVF